MSTSPVQEPSSNRPAQDEIPDRLCTWCKVPMIKRIVGGGRYLHYTCPKCVFQHAVRREHP